MKEVEDTAGNLDSFFAELDASVAKSKEGVEKAEASLLLRRRASPQFGRRSFRSLAPGRHEACFCLVT